MGKGWFVVAALLIGIVRFGVASAEFSFPHQIPVALLEKLTSPEELVRFLHREIRFRHDEDLFGTKDYWQSPEEFLSHRSGDCEDYAIFAKAILDRLGIRAFIFSIFGANGYSHTVCLFQDEDGRYRIINQDKLMSRSAHSIEEAASMVNPGWVYAGIAERRGARGLFLEEITNPKPHLFPFEHSHPWWD